MVDVEPKLTGFKLAPKLNFSGCCPNENPPVEGAPKVDVPRDPCNAVFVCEKGGFDVPLPNVNVFPENCNKNNTRCLH